MRSSSRKEHGHEAPQANPLGEPHGRPARVAAAGLQHEPEGTHSVQQRHGLGVGQSRALPDQGQPRRLAFPHPAADDLSMGSGEREVRAGPQRERKHHGTGHTHRVPAATATDELPDHGHRAGRDGGATAATVRRHAGRLPTGSATRSDWRLLTPRRSGPRGPLVPVVRFEHVRAQRRRAQLHRHHGLADARDPGRVAGSPRSQPG